MQNRASFLREYNGSPVKIRRDLFEARMQLKANKHFYDYYLEEEDQPTRDWLRYQTETFFKLISVFKGYPEDLLWKYKKFIDQPLTDVLKTFVYQVADNESGRNFVHDLENICDFHEIHVRTIFNSSIKERYEILNPCISNTYQNAWLDYDSESIGDTDSEAIRDAYFDGSPFILKEIDVIVENPLGKDPMSVRTFEENDYINYLQKEIANKFKIYMDNPANVKNNLLSVGKALIAPLNISFVQGEQTLNLKLSREYVDGAHFSGSAFTALYPYQSNLVKSVITAIESKNENNFINAFLKLAAAHPVMIQRKVVLEIFPDLFVTKDFPSFKIYSSYLHYLLNCTQFH
ncbi:hypothetical protein [Fluviispira vulneris]|uniref:hypothetical protein n=1 Tax=Fluviispira vulneris TaxID=2763012 RepID=UPI0016464649|nr:hypothetical protein [Fluviispira vulneris]